MSSRATLMSDAARLLAPGLLLAWLVEPCFAQQPQPSPAPPQIVMSPGSQLLLSRLQTGQTPEGYFDVLRMEFSLLDADSDGKITQTDIDLHGLMETIQARALGVTMVLRYDLDGDSFVTEEEIRRAMRYEMRSQRAQAAITPAGNGPGPLELLEKQIDRLVQTITALDTDKDGRVSIAEAAKFSLGGDGVQRAMMQHGLAAQTRQALTLDTASKGELSLADFQAAGEALFRKVDADNDGKLSQQELRDYRKQPSASNAGNMYITSKPPLARPNADVETPRANVEAAQAAKAACVMPAPSPNARVVLFSSYKAESLSSVTIGSQEVVVFAGRVVIEPGAEPLYIVIPTSSPVIWQFSGAVDRVERLVLSSGQTLPGKTRYDPNLPGLAGATGLPQDKVSFPARVGCLNYFSEVPSGGSIGAVNALREMIGREPFKVAGAYSVHGVSLPSGTIESLDKMGKKLIIEKGSGTLRIDGDASNIILRSGPSQARDELYRFNPGGLVEIDPKYVVSNLPAQAYEVLPEEAGLVQLLQSGALTQNRGGEYIVQKKMRFPTGLAGAHSVKFLVLRGTPVPDGDPGHSCVSTEEPYPERKFEACR